MEVLQLDELVEDDFLLLFFDDDEPVCLMCIRGRAAAGCRAVSPAALGCPRFRFGNSFGGGGADLVPPPIPSCTPRTVLIEKFSALCSEIFFFNRAPWGGGSAGWLLNKGVGKLDPPGGQLAQENS